MGHNFTLVKLALFCLAGHRSIVTTLTVLGHGWLGTDRVAAFLMFNQIIFAFVLTVTNLTNKSNMVMGTPDVPHEVFPLAISFTTNYTLMPQVADDTGAVFNESK